MQNGGAPAWPKLEAETILQDSTGCACMYVYICMCMYVCIHMYVCACMYIYMYVHVCLYIYVRIVLVFAGIIYIIS